MKRIVGLFGVFFILSALLFIKPHVGSGGLKLESFSKGRIYDREGRVLFRTRELYRAYYVGGFPVPKELRPYLKDDGAEPPYPVAKALTAEESKALSRVPGVVLEKYLRPEYPGGAVFSGVLEPLLKSRVPLRRDLVLTLSWDTQEALYHELETLKGFFRRIGGVVVEIPSGEVYALGSLPREGELVPVRTLFPVSFLPKELPVEVFGEPTGLEIPEAPGIFWPGGKILATPVQVVRAFAGYLCGTPPKLHLRKQEGYSGLCRKRDRGLKRVYNYLDGRRWFYLTLWPEDRPRFLIALAGELKQGTGFRVDLSGILKELARYLPPEAEERRETRGFPDLRGLTLKAALETLGKRSLKIQFQGFGKVVRQEPLPGTPWEKVKNCVLYLSDET